MAMLDASGLDDYTPPAAAGSQAAPESGRLDASGLDDYDSPTTAITTQEAATSKTGPTAAKPKEQDTLGNIAEQVPSGLQSFAYGLAGLPIAIGRTVYNVPAAIVNKVAGRDVAPYIPGDTIGSTDWIRKTLGSINPNLNLEENAAPTGPLARAAKTGTEFLAAGLIPGSTLGRLGTAIAPRTPVVAETLRSLGAPSGGTDMATSALGNAAAGITSSEANELPIPEQYKPLVSTGAGILGGGLTALGSDIAGQTVGTGLRTAYNYGWQPLSESGRQVLAGQKLAEASKNPEAVKDILNNPPETFTSQMTAPLTGDLGLAEMERGVMNRNPGAFMERRGEQNEQRVGAMEDLEPASGAAPQDVVQSLKNFRDALEEQTQQRINTASSAQERSLQGLGEGVAPVEAGEQMRTAMAGARAGAKANERGLWEAVDPNHTLTIGAGNTLDMAGRLRAELPEAAKPMEGEEADIFNLLHRWGSDGIETIPFSEMAALQSRLKETMRDEFETAGDSASYRRMSMLNKAIEDDLDGVASRITNERAAVAAGRMSEEDTFERNLREAVANWRTAREAGATPLTGTGEAGPLRATSLPPTGGEEGQAGRGFYDAAGDQGVQPSFDEAARERLNAARAATRERAETHDNPTLRPIMRQQMRTGPYNMLAGDVPSKIFGPGPASGQRVQRFAKAVGADAAVPILRDYIVGRARAAAMRNGQVDAKALAKFRQQHAEALRELPRLDHDLGTVERLTQAVSDVTRAQDARLKQAELGSVGKLMNADPEDVPNLVGRIFTRSDNTAEMRRLRQALGGERDSVGQRGLRRAVVEHMMQRLQSNTEAGTSGVNLLKRDQFQTFVKKNRQVLEAAGFSPDQLNTMTRVADDLQMANRTFTAARIPGQSNTTQDIIQAEIARKVWSYARLIGATLGGGFAASTGAPLVGATMLGPLTGTLGAGAGLLLAQLREHGIKEVNDLVTHAMLDPGLARDLLNKVDLKKLRRQSQSFGDRMEATKARALRRVQQQTALSVATNGFAAGGSVTDEDEPESKIIGANDIPGFSSGPADTAPAFIPKPSGPVLTTKEYEAAKDAWEPAQLLPMRRNTMTGQVDWGMPAVLSNTLSAIDTPRKAWDGEYGADPASNPRAISDALNFTTTVGGMGGVVPKPANSLGIFGGQFAIGADRDALESAMKMTHLGADRNDIWRKTGWGLMPGGKWAHEIPDDMSGLKSTAVHDMLNRLADGPDASEGNPFTQGQMGDILNHEKLYDAYPEMQHIPTMARLLGPNDEHAYNGFFDASQPLLKAESRNANSGENSARGVMLHELQHAVQTTEGWPRGGSPQDPNLPPRVAEMAPQSRALISDLLGEQKAYLAARMGNDPMTPEDRKAVVNSLAAQWNRENPQKAAALTQALKDVRGATEPFELYQRLAGEMQARNTQRRMNMSPELRRDVPPWETQDYYHGLPQLITPQQAYYIQGFPYPKNFGPARYRGGLVH